LATSAWSVVTVADSGVVSSDATSWPTLTCWPTDTPTADTVPDIGNARSAWFAGAIVATPSNVDSTLPIDADAS
jgi:hypothetical protein